MPLTGLQALVAAGGRPTEFLLRTDLEGVLSADTIIWPSIFNCSVALERSAGLPQPEWIGMNAPFWDDLGVLSKAVATRESDHDHPFWLIAATWHTDLGFEGEAMQKGKFLGPYVESTTPERPDTAWRFLGFDITDGGFISGLSNCGYDDAERDGIAAEWARYLNRNHLFDDLQPAFKFRNLTNARVHEHAPFFVIGLWLIAEGAQH
jgi:hypothetical protein